MNLREYILVRCAELREDTRKRRLKPAKDEELLQGLLLALPPIGTPFSENKRRLWIDMAKATFDLLYDDPQQTKRYSWTYPGDDALTHS